MANFPVNKDGPVVKILILLDEGLDVASIDDQGRSFDGLEIKIKCHKNSEISGENIQNVDVLRILEENFFDIDKVASRHYDDVKVHDQGVVGEE